MNIKYLSKGAVLSDYNFTDCRGHSHGEVCRNVRDSFLQSTVSKLATPLLKSLSGHKTKTLDFRFLPYSEGEINSCASQGRDVLSAYFSGCIMARYKRDGEWRVCHVSTGGENDRKQEWAAIKNDPKVSHVTEFKPSDYNQNSQRVLGLITSAGACYSIGCDPTPNPAGGPMLLKVNQLKRVV